MKNSMMVTSSVAFVAMAMLCGCVADAEMYEVDEESEAMGEYPASVDDEESGEDEGAVDEVEAPSASPQGFLGVDKCKNVSIGVSNRRSRTSGNRAIKVTRVKLFSREDARWHSEGLPDRIVGYEDMVTFPRQDLENVYYERISEWKIYYKVLQADGTWGGEVFQIYDGNPAWRCTNHGSIILTVR